jgi:hypothetical protein
MAGLREEKGRLVLRLEEGSRAPRRRHHTTAVWGWSNWTEAASEAGQNSEQVGSDRVLSGC